MCVECLLCAIISRKYVAAAPRVPRRARSPRRWRGSRASCRLPGSSSSACHPPAQSSRSEVLISILSGYRASHLSRVPHRLLASQRALAPDQPLHCPRVVRSGTLHNNSHLAPQAVSQSYHHCNLRIAASSRFLRFLVGLGTSWLRMPTLTLISSSTSRRGLQCSPPRSWPHVYGSWRSFG